MKKWKDWCRLCAKESYNNEHYMFIKTETLPQLSQVIQKHFKLLIDLNDGKPAKVCEFCFQFLNMIRVFNERCMKAESMYNTIITNSYGMNNINLVRKQFITDDNFNIFNYINADFNKIQVKEKPATVTNIKIERLNTQVNAAVVEEPKVNCNTNNQNQVIVQVANQVTNQIANQVAIQNNFERTETVLPLEIQLSVSGSYAPAPVKKEIRMITMDGSIGYVEVPDYGDGKTFDYSKTTVKSESTEGAFICSTCSKTFTTKYLLKAHEKVHLPDDLKKIHQCTECSKKFSTTGILTTHIKTVHFNERSHVCNHCGKGFKQKCALKEHQLTHTEDRPFQCTECSKKFKSMVRLKVHKQQHSDFHISCEYCGKLFTNNTTYRNHQQEEHPEYVFAQLAMSMP